MPDALSKTVPIWIAVLNRLLFPEKPGMHDFRTPEEVVSRSEHAQIEERLPSLTGDVQGLWLDVQSLRLKLRDKPLEPIWVTPDDSLPHAPPEHSDANLIVLCTASGRSESSEQADLNYVQGAADDSESWAHGLDGKTFWKHRDHLLSTCEDDLPAVIEDLVSQSRSKSDIRPPVLIDQTKSIWIANNAAAETLYSNFDIVVSCSERTSDILAAGMKDRYVHLECTSGKVGSRQLRGEFWKINHLTNVLSPTSKILFTCQTGKDLAVGVALGVISFFCCNDGTIQPSGAPVKRSKPMIKKRLSWIMVSMPDATPSRATLQSVNAFLLGEVVTT